jgi:hypothetical protein
MLPSVEVAVASEDESAAFGVPHLVGDRLDVASGRDH